jgi:hypothetical protein
MKTGSMKGEEEEEVGNVRVPCSVRGQGPGHTVSFPAVALPVLRAAYLLPSPQQHQRAHSVFSEAPLVSAAPSVVDFLAPVP